MSEAMIGLEESGYKRQPSVALDNLSTDELILVEAAFDRLLTA